MGGSFRSLVNGVKPIILMVVIQAGNAAVNILYELAQFDGMSMKIMVAYRFTFAAAFMVPLALILEWNSRPRFTWKIAFQAFLCGLFGASLGHNLFAEGLAFTSATYLVAIANLIPAMTYILTILFRLEKFAIGTLAGKAKLIGTVVNMSGAMVLILYKGVEIKTWSTDINLLDKYHGTTSNHVSTHNKEIFGYLLAIASCLSISFWLIIQTAMAKSYPFFSVTALMCVTASIQASAYALCYESERDWSKWKLGWNIRLLAVSFTGVVGSGLIVVVMTWCARIKGTMYVSSFFPLALVFVTLFGTLFLGERLHFGSIIGAILVISGVYAALWGKGREMKNTTQLAPAETPREYSQDSQIDKV